MRSPSFHWRFPLPTAHHGVLTGNGRMGAMFWGSGSTLQITIGRADLWDHRGGMTWSAEMSFARISQFLEAGDEAGLRKAFENASDRQQQPTHPSILPVGRVELTLPGELSSAALNERTGVVTIELAGGHRLTAELSALTPVLVITGLAEAVPTRVLSAGELAMGPAGGFADGWKERGLVPSTGFGGNGIRGMVQELPADPAIALATRWDRDACYIATERGTDAEAAMDNVLDLLQRAVERGTCRLASESRTWWDRFWQHAPRVSMPNATLEFLARYGLYKLAASTNPDGVACGLQGPWIEDDRLPAWASDYHFNINVQMCYGPAFPGGAGEHLRPLWRMLHCWEPQLRENARLFVGIPDGLMLPHAVDDRGTHMGGFWTGTIDHGCTAWVARMMFDAWDHGFEDDGFLRDMVYPWLTGALNVYRAMARRNTDGSFSLPVTVSPEYGGSGMNAWGENASFQLAACHSLLDALEVTCGMLGLEYLPEWTAFRQGLPHACIASAPSHGWDDRSGEAVMLWKGTPLGEAHRHHSHLAGITPFRTIDPLSAQWRKAMDKSLGQWVHRGVGTWAGWSFGWASQIHSRVGNAVAAEYLLEAFARYFVNVGGGTFHNCLHRGLTTMGAGGISDWKWNAMQLDGGQGACSAVLDMLAHDRRGVVALFAGCPSDWEEVSFDNISLPGAFRVSATRSNGRLKRLEVFSRRQRTFRYLDPSTGEVRCAEVQPGQATTVT